MLRICRRVRTIAQGGELGYKPLPSSGTLATTPLLVGGSALFRGLWQTSILTSVQEFLPLDVDFPSHDAPTYYGMLVAV